MAKPASPPIANFLEYLGNEETNFLVSLTNLRREFDVFTHLDKLYQEAISKARATHEDDLVVLQLLLLVHFHYYHSSATLLRCHLSEALSSLRTGIDAGLNAYRIIEDRPSQRLYVERDKTFMFPKRFYEKECKENPSSFPLAEALLNRHAACSQFGAHADIDVFFHRLELPSKPGQLLKLQYFQHPKNHREFAWYYLLLMHTFLIILQVFEKFLVKEKSFVTNEWANSILQLGRHLEELMAKAKTQAEAGDQ